MSSMISSSGTTFYSLLYFNPRLGFNRLKYLYPVISAIVDALPANTKFRESTSLWMARVRFLASWAAHIYIHLIRVYVYISMTNF